MKRTKRIARIYPVLTLILFAALLLSCKDDDAPSCVECTADTTVPFEVCRESNGNASVNGEDTGTNYDVYVSGLEEAGASCGR